MENFITKLNIKKVRHLENIEIEKEYEAGRPKTTKSRIDLILKDVNDNNFLFVEVKAPNKFESDKEYIEGQLFKLARLEKKPIKYLFITPLNLKGMK